MPMVTVYVASVRPMFLPHGLTRYQVFTRRAPGEIWSEMYSTLDSLKASLCDQAAKQGFAVVIGSRETRYGPEIVTVEPAEVAA